MSPPLQEKAMLPFRWVFPLEFAQLQKFPRDMPTDRLDLDSSSLRLSLDCGLLTKLAITAPVLFNVVFNVAHVFTDLEKKMNWQFVEMLPASGRLLKVTFARFSGFSTSACYL